MPTYHLVRVISYIKPGDTVEGALGQLKPVPPGRDPLVAVSNVLQHLPNCIVGLTPCCSATTAECPALRLVLVPVR